MKRKCPACESIVLVDCGRVGKKAKEYRCDDCGEVFILNEKTTDKLCDCDEDCIDSLNETVGLDEEFADEDEDEETFLEYEDELDEEECLEYDEDEDESEEELEEDDEKDN